MPILAAIGPTGPTKPPGPPKDNRYIAFRALDGSDLIEWSTDAWIAQDKATGLDAPPVNLTTSKYQGLPGSRLDAVDVDEREVFLPLWIRPTSRDFHDVMAGLARVQAMADHYGKDYQSHEGTFDLLGYCDGVERSLRVAYKSGLEGNYGYPDDFSIWRMFPLTLLAADPHAKGARWATETLKMPDAVPFLRAATADAGDLRLASDRALGQRMPVTVGGNVPSAAVIEIGGEGSSVHVTYPGGGDITIAGPFGPTSTFTLDTGRNGYAALNGVASDAAWARVHPSSYWPPLPPSDAEITIQINDATATSWARVSGVEQWRGLWGG